MQHHANAGSEHAVSLEYLPEFDAAGQILARLVFTGNLFESIRHDLILDRRGYDDDPVSVTKDKVTGFDANTSADNGHVYL